MSFEQDQGEELRKCPTCRSMISVMATRCRHCGEKVSRPKTEEERFTIQDLGGVSEANYKVSKHVMGALEAFRAEELQATGADSAGQGAASSSLIELDAAHRELAEAVLDNPEERMRRQHLARTPRRSDDTLRNVALVLGGAVFLVALVAIGLRLSEYLRGRNAVEVPSYVNNALSWLEDGRHTKMEALEEANRALRYDPTPENERIADTVRAAIDTEVRAMLNAVPWDRNKLSQASAMVNRAVEVDVSRQISDLRSEVQREVAAFKLVLTEVDSTAGTAKFSINDPYYSGEKEQVVKVGDYLADRFLIKAIRSNQVEFVDSEVAGPDGDFRRLSVRVLDPIRAMP